jgi:hypothetical protein
MMKILNWEIWGILEVWWGNRFGRSGDDQLWFDRGVWSKRVWHTHWKSSWDEKSESNSLSNSLIFKSLSLTNPWIHLNVGQVIKLITKFPSPHVWVSHVCNESSKSNRTPAHVQQDHSSSQFHSNISPFMTFASFVDVAVTFVAFFTFDSETRKRKAEIKTRFKRLLWQQTKTYYSWKVPSEKFFAEFFSPNTQTKRLKNSTDDSRGGGNPSSFSHVKISDSFALDFPSNFWMFVY